MPLTKKYIDAHLTDVHNYDSFGRSLTDLALKSAKQKLGEGSEDKIDFDAKVSITTVNDVCVDVQVCLPLVGCTSVHVGV